MAILAPSPSGLTKKITPAHKAGRAVFGALALIFLGVGVICCINAVDWINKPFPGFLVNERLVVTGISRPHWTGTTARLGYPDQVTAVNGKPVASAAELQEVIRQTPKGESLSYNIARRGEVVQVAIPPMTFELDDFLKIFGLYFLLGVIYGLCGVLVFLMKPDREVSWAFFLACYFLGLYYLVNFDVVATHQGCTRLYLLASALFPAAVVHLSQLFPQPLPLAQRHRLVKIIPYTISGLLIVLLQMCYPQPVIARLYRLVTLYTFVSAAALLTSALWAYYTGLSALNRQRAKVVLFGAALAFPIPALANIFTIYNVTLLNMEIISNPWLRFPIIIFPAAIAYAIVKHNLFDVDVYIKRTVGYGIMTTLVGSAYFALQVLFRTAVLQPVLGGYGETVYPLLFALLVVFLFNPLDRKIQCLVDRLFFRQPYDYKHTVAAVTEALTTVLSLTEVINRILATLRQEMCIDTAGVVLIDAHKKTCHSLFITDGPNSHRDLIQVQHLPQRDPLLRLVIREKKLITRDDLQEGSQFKAEQETCLERFTALGAFMALPLVIHDEVNGVMFLGFKKSGLYYTREDLELLKTLANQGAVAIENAQLANQIKQEQTVRTNLARYLSPQVVEDIISHDVKVRLEGEFKEVTVLISDIRDFVKMTSMYAPNILVKVLNEYFTEMARIIFEHQGSIDKFVGDSIVAVFGSLIPLKNPARNAVSAAVQMMHYMPALNERWQKQHRLTAPMEIGIGVSTGEVYLGNVGSPERMEFTIIGDTVNIASRFSVLAQGRQILITEETLERLGAGTRVQQLPSTEVKGKEGPMDVFEVLYF